MHPRFKYNYDALWEAVNDPEKFELLSYLILALKFPELKLYKTPKTRDNKRDAEGMINDQKYLLESKFTFNALKGKLSHKEVGSNINMAMYEMADSLWIFTNGYAGLDLLQFIDWHNEIHESVLHKPLKIVVLDRHQVSMHALRYQSNDYHNKLNALEFTGYKSVKKAEQELKKVELLGIGKGLIEKIEQVKSKKQHDFFFYPTLKGLNSSGWTVNERLELLQGLFQIEVYFQSGNHQSYLPKIRVPVGYSFSLILKISNFFFDQIDYQIKFQPAGVVKLIGPFDISGNTYSLQQQVNGVSDQLIRITTRIERLPFSGINGSIFINGLQIPLPIDHIEVENLFFLAPFIGEKNNDSLALYKEKIDRSIYGKQFFIGLVTGEAGVGKSRFIQELVDHCDQYKNKLFRYELIAAEGRRSFIRDIIGFFSGIDPVSFVDIPSQLVEQFKNDHHFSLLFKNEKEFQSFRETVGRVIDRGLDQANATEISKLSEFIANILLRLGARQLTVFIIEDLHHADQAIFQFIRGLYNILKTQRSMIVFLLAGRTEAKDVTPVFREFELALLSDPTYSVMRTEILPLSDKDSLSLIKELVVTDQPSEAILQRRVLAKTGNNPFNIIHTLLYLKNIGIIIEKNHDFEWHHIDKLESVTLHAEIEKLLTARFRFYGDLPGIGLKIIDLLAILAVFESKLSRNDLSAIYGANLDEVISFLREERVIRTVGGTVMFDHENLLQFTQKVNLPNRIAVAEMIIAWQLRKKWVGRQPALFIRALYLCFDTQQQRFFKHCWNFIGQAVAKEDWAQTLRYAGLYLDRIRGNEELQPAYKRYQVMFNIAYTESESADLDTAIRHYEELEALIKANEHPKLIYQIIMLRSRLYRCDAYLMGGEYSRSRAVLTTFNVEIEQLWKTKARSRTNKELMELYCWGLNRLGVTYRTLGDTEKAISLIETSLKYARKIKNAYYIHHNYYDLAGCLIHQDKIKEAFTLHQKSLMPVLNEDAQRNARVRVQIRTGIFYFLLDQPERALGEIETAIRMARDGNYYWELTRGLINGANIYFQQKDLLMAAEGYKTCLQVIELHNAKTFNTCLYNNIAFLDLYRFSINRNWPLLESALGYFNKVLELLVPNPESFVVPEYGNLQLKLFFENLDCLRSYLTDLGLDHPASKLFMEELKERYGSLLDINVEPQNNKFLAKFKMKFDARHSFHILYMSFS